MAAKSSAERAKEYRDRLARKANGLPSEPSLPSAPLDPMALLVDHLRSEIDYLREVVLALAGRDERRDERDGFRDERDERHVTENVTVRDERNRTFTGHDAGLTRRAGPLRAPAPARPVPCISSSLQGFIQDPGGQSQSFQDSNGASASASERVTNVTNAVTNGAFASVTNGVTNVTNGHGPNGLVTGESGHLSEIENSGEGEGGKEGPVPELPSIARRLPPEFDAEAVERERARQLRAADEWERTNGGGS